MGKDHFLSSFKVVAHGIAHLVRCEDVQADELLRVLLRAHRLLDLAISNFFAVGGARLRKPLDLLPEGAPVRSFEQSSGFGHPYAHLVASLARVERFFVHEVHVAVLGNKLSFLAHVALRIERGNARLRWDLTV